MNEAKAVVLVVLLSLTAAAVVLWNQRRPPLPVARERPDVLLVTIDTLRADRLGSYGYTARATPTLDAIAADGVRFAHTIAPTPLTLPSHASLLTGVWPTVHGVRDNIGFVLDASRPTVAERFSASGYLTAAFVSAFPLQARFGLARGFGHYDDRLTAGGTTARPAAVERRADDTVNAVLEWLSVTAAHGQPMFLWVHFFDPHAPYQPPEPFATRFKEQPYDGEIAFVDSQMARVIDEIRRRRAGRPLTLAITADHGEGLGEHGEPTHGLFIYDTTMRVPLMLAGAGVPQHRIVDAQVRLIDVAPTLADLAGVPVLADAQGETLRTLFENGDTGSNRPAYLESLFGRLCCGWAPLHGWRDGRFTLIDAPRPELYDNTADPRQLQNLAASHRDDFDRLNRQLTAVMSSVPATGPRRVDRDAAERLRSLGYLSAGGDGGGMRPSLRDPKDMADVAARLGRAIETVDSDPASAGRELERLAQEDPENALIRRHLVRVRLRGGDTAGARRELQALTARGDRSVETLELAADLSIAAGDFQAARSALERIYKETNDADAGLKLGIVLIRLRQLDAAIETFRTVVARAPTHQEALVDLGGALLQAKRPREALEAFERAVAAGARGPVVWNGLAAARLASGDTTGAAAALRESLRANADQPQVHAMLQQLTTR